MPVTYELVDSIGVVTINNPPVNALSRAVRTGLQNAVRAAQQDASSAILILCDGRTFVAGADIREFGKPPAEPHLPDLLNEIEASTKPVVAALHGTALGGGFELALACHYRIALAGSKVGLPEVRLGLLPGAGGTQRVPRLAGIPTALELITSGTPIDASGAREQGLIDEVVDGDLRKAALVYVQGLVAAGAGCRRSSELPAPGADPAVLAEFRRQLEKKARGQIAPQRIVDCVEAASSMPFPEGLAAERKAFVELMAGPQSAALRHLFFAEREAAKVRDLPADVAARDVQRVGVIGAGTMGSGIAMNFASIGMPVTLLEVNDDALSRGLEAIAKNYAGGVKRGKLTEAEAAATRERIAGTTDYSDLATTDLVVEAVFENLGLKQDIFEQLDKICKPGTILATNTSYQDVNRIAAATQRPEDVLGLHFFSPAHIMKLLEIVRADKTADDVLATCIGLAKKIGKIPVIAGVCYGFIGNRMLQHYMREAQLCLLEGSTPDAIDTAMQQWGMAMGPMRVADLAGLDVSYKARQSLPVEERGDIRTYRVADALVEMGRLGQKSGAGFYRYDADTREHRVDDAVMEIVEREAGVLNITRRDIDAGEIVDRLVYALINEGLNVVEEGIAQRPSDIDVVYVYGYGFPAWRGGPMHYADTVGLGDVLARINEFRERLDSAHWTPSKLLEKLVGEGRSLTEWAADR
ncbi:MAG: 3-hydroxyacyl-CoA dehydrogenase NAD-binding domain-containing protein [Woeseiaceae bacterium]|nr:3-hydroxyacyl-CoA dehydrogenase NAD-binding domain-containing protein [Woeseiaceae bacterium]